MQDVKQLEGLVLRMRRGGEVVEKLRLKLARKKGCLDGRPGELMGQMLAWGSGVVGSFADSRMHSKGLAQIQVDALAVCLCCFFVESSRGDERQDDVDLGRSKCGVQMVAAHTKNK